MFTRSTKKSVATALTALLIAGCGAGYEDDLELGEGKAEQTHWGNYEAQPYIDAGWSGYLVQATITKDKPFAGYKSGDYTYYVQNPRCNGGDCPFSEEVVFKALGGEHGKRLAGAIPLGKATLRDDGDVDTTEVTMANNAPIALITENQVQSAAKFDEQQTAVFTGFRGDGELAEDLGHIEEMDAPRTVTQPESLYRRLPDGSDEFVTTVIERVLFNNDEENSEAFRGATRWCQSDKWRTTDNILEKVKKDSFDLEECNADTQPIVSKARMGKSAAKQFFTGRSTSDVTLWHPDTDQKDALSYTSATNVDVLGAFGFNDNGTQYYIQKDDKNLTWVNSDKFITKSNIPKGKIAGIKNYPKAKLFTVNWDNERKFKGSKKEKYWAKKAPEAVAMVVHEKLNESYVDIKGDVCKVQGWREGNEEYATRCGLKTRYTLNFWILFPPKVNGETWSQARKVALLDGLLAATPDQTQQSPELVAAEKYLDFVIALEKVRTSGAPDVITLADLVDMGTEEDHMTAQNKIWDAFTEMGVVSKREGWTEPTFEFAVEKQTSGGEDKPLF